MDLRALSIYGTLVMVGCILGYGVTSSHYKSKLLALDSQYKEAVIEARSQEEKWRKLSDEQEAEYRKKLDSIVRNNDKLVKQLRKQLAAISSSGMPKNARTSSVPDDSSGRTKVANEVGDLAEFSSQCAKRADELILQVDGLQKFIKSVR